MYDAAWPRWGVPSGGVGGHHHGWEINVVAWLAHSPTGLNGQDITASTREKGNET